MFRFRSSGNSPATCLVFASVLATRGGKRKGPGVVSTRDVSGSFGDRRIGSKDKGFTMKACASDSKSPRRCDPVSGFRVFSISSIVRVGRTTTSGSTACIGRNAFRYANESESAWHGRDGIRVGSRRIRTRGGALDGIPVLAEKNRSLPAARVRGSRTGKQWAVFWRAGMIFQESVGVVQEKGDL